jgi:hypothetical protein
MFSPEPGLDGAKKAALGGARELRPPSGGWWVHWTNCGGPRICMVPATSDYDPPGSLLATLLNVVLALVPIA